LIVWMAFCITQLVLLALFVGLTIVVVIRFDTSNSVRLDLLKGTPLMAGDGAAVSNEAVLQLRATDAAELLHSLWLYG